MIKQRIEKSLSGKNFQIHIGNLSFRIFHGLTAENVVLKSTQKEKSKIGHIERVTASLNIFGFLPGHFPVKQVNLYNASVDIPLSDNSKYYLPIRHANAEIFIKPRFLKISNSSFIFENIRFSMNGTLLNLHVFQPTPDHAKQREIYLQRLKHLIEELGKVQYPNGPPQADIVFQGDFATPQKIQIIDLTLRAKDIRYHSISLKHVGLYASYAQGTLQVQQLRVQDSQGDLTTWGLVNLNASKGYVTLNSSLNLTPLLTEFAPHFKGLRKLKPLHMEQPPQVHLDTHISWGKKNLQCNGSASVILKSFSYKNTSFPLLDLRLVAKNNVLEIQQLDLISNKGKLTATGGVNFTTSKARCHLSSSLDPLPILTEFLPPCTIRRIEKLRIESPPQVDISTDISWENKKLQYKGSGSLALRSFSYNKQFFPKLNLRFTAENGTAQLEQLLLQDARGELNATGMANFDTSKGNLDLHSSINFIPILHGLIPKSKMKVLWDVQMTFPPQVDLNTEFSWSDKKFKYKGIGSADFHSLFYKKKFFPQLDFKFTAENNRTNIKDLHLQTQSGALKADILIAPDKFRLQADSTANPKEFIDFFDPPTRAFFNAMEIVDSPHISLRLEGPKPDLAVLSGKGELILGRTAVRKAWIDFARSKFYVKPQRLIFSDFLLGRGGGRGSGTVTYDFKLQHVHLQNIDSTMVPEEVLRWISPPIAKVISVYKFHAPPHVQVNGIVHLNNANLNNVWVHIDSKAGLNYTLLKRTLNFGATTADVHVEGPWVKVGIPSARIFQGTMALAANVSIDPKNPNFRVDLSFSHIDFAKLTKLYFDYDSSKGFLSGTFGFKAQLGKESDLAGSGSFHIENGTVLSVPFLGPISLILNQILPGAGNAPAKNATVDFQVANRIITTDNLRFEGHGFTLLGTGGIKFLTGEMNMLIKINARGLPGLIFFPISRLFEYESEGTIMKPEWHLRSPFSIKAPWGLVEPRYRKYSESLIK